MFNPFNIEIHEFILSGVALEELKMLKEKKLAEGLFVEYKETFVSNEKIAHSIASFANSHGGWYFIGIEAESQTNIAKNFNGVDLSVRAQPLEDINNILKTHVNPMPRVHIKLTNLGNGKGIISVLIPESDDTPHLTKDGKIYRRNENSSDPIPETDRHTIDKLFEKSKTLDTYVNNFCKSDLIYPASQKGQAFLEVDMIPYPLNSVSIDIFSASKIEELKNFINSPYKILNSVEIGVPFDNIAASFNSITFRQTNKDEHLSFATLYFRLFSDGSVKIIIPLPNAIPPNTKFYDDFWGLLSEDNREIYFEKIIDGFNLFNTFNVLVGKYIEYLKKNGFNDNLLARYIISNSRRKILFFDSESYLNQVRENGINSCHANEIKIPDRIRNNFFKIDISEETLNLAPNFIFVVSSMGIFQQTYTESLSSDWIRYLEDEVERRKSTSSP